MSDPSLKVSMKRSHQAITHTQFLKVVRRQALKLYCFNSQSISYSLKIQLVVATTMSHHNVSLRSSGIYPKSQAFELIPQWDTPLAQTVAAVSCLAATMYLAAVSILGRNMPHAKPLKELMCLLDWCW